MKYLVLSRSEAMALSHTGLSAPCVVISISDTGPEELHFAPNPQIKALLRLSFDDVDRNESHAMTDDDADQVATFCEQWFDDADLVVQCEAGIPEAQAYVPQS